MNTNTEFEALHPRDTGKFAKKGQGVPEESVALANPVVGYRYLGTAYTGEALLLRLNDVAGADLQTVGELDELLDSWAFNAAANRENHGLPAPLPVPLRESEVTIADHPSLGREFWTPAGTTYTSARDFKTKALLGAEPLTASDALEDWANALKLPEDVQDELWEGTDYSSQTKAWNLEKIADNARELGLDPEAIGMPTRHN